MILLQKATITAKGIMPMDLSSQENQNLLVETLFQHIPQYIFWKDTHSIYLGCNEKYAQLIGLKNSQEIIGKTDFEIGWLPDGDTAEKFQEGDKKTLQGNYIINKEEWLSLKNGARILTLVNKVPITNKQGLIVGVLGVATDITEKNAIEKNIEKINHQLKGMTIVSASISHELRTPLAAIKSAVKGVNFLVPILVETYKTAQSQHLTTTFISNSKLNLLQNVITSLEKKVDQANRAIDMLLENIKKYNTGQLKDSKKCSAKRCINKALAHYIFPSGIKPKIIWDNKKDFIFYGKERPIIHVLFNLLKNAIYFIHKSHKGYIHIWLDEAEDYNTIHFKDTSVGINPEYLNKIFEPFFTIDTNKGTGIGLAFCQITLESFGGSITCESVWHEYTEFIMNFPKKLITQEK